MVYLIRIMNVGKPPRLFQVFDKGFRRDAIFQNSGAAKEAVRIIDMLRNDTAYLGCEIVEEE